VREVTVIEKINSEINIFIIYNFSTHCSCFVRMNKDGGVQSNMPEMSWGQGDSSDI